MNPDKSHNLLFRLSNVWVVSGKAMTIISLVIIPLLVIVSHYIIYDQARYIAYLEQDPKTGKHTVHYPKDYVLILNIIFYFQTFVLIFILVVYPPYPAPSSIERYFKERGYRKAVDEYEFIKKLLYFVIPLVLVFGIWSTESIAKPILDNTIQFLPSEPLLEHGMNQKSISESLDEDELYIDFPALLLMVVFLSAIFKMICIRIRKDFRLYYAKGCFVICHNQNNEVKKMSYFIMGLNSYNHYLRRLISLEISDLKTKIYSKIASSPMEEKTKVMSNIVSIFLTKKMEENTLEPVRQLTKLTQKSISEFLTKETFLNKLKEWTAIASVIVTMIVSLFPFVIRTISE